MHDTILSTRMPVSKLLSHEFSLSVQPNVCLNCPDESNKQTRSHQLMEKWRHDKNEHVRTTCTK